MGILGAALGVGFIFGPAIGGILSPDYSLAALIASGLSIVNCLGEIHTHIYIYTHTHTEREREREREGSREGRVEIGGNR